MTARGRAPWLMTQVSRLDDGLAAPRVRRLVRLLLLVQIGLACFFIAGSHDAFEKNKPTRPTTTDFASFYAAGRLADEGRAGSAYDPALHKAMMERVTAQGIDYRQVFLNPPVFLLVCAPLARLPYLLAFVLFEATTFSLWLMLATRIAGGGKLAAMTLAAIPSVFWAAGWGQNSFLSASLMALGTLLLARRPWLAGAAFGALCFKPHFGILIPVALLAGREWRAIAGAALSASGLTGLSVLAFGTAPWRAFLHSAAHARDTIESGRILFSGHVDAGGAARLLGLPSSAAWGVQGAATLAAAVAVLLLWRREARASAATRYASLVAGTLAAMPFLLFYDLVTAGIAAAWIAGEARVLGWRPGEKAVLAGLVLVDLLAFSVASLTPFAIGAVVAPAILTLAWRRARIEPSRPLTVAG